MENINKKLIEKSLRLLFDQKHTTQEECEDILIEWYKHDLSRNGYREMCNDFITQFEEKPKRLNQFLLNRVLAFNKAFDKPLNELTKKYDNRLNNVHLNFK